MPFETDYASILAKIDRIDPIRYGQNRNFINGSVSYLSPYISRGVISTRQVLETVLAKGVSLHQIIPFVKELCWRDYFQRVGQHKDLNKDIKQEQIKVSHQQMPSAVIAAKTGINGIDQAIESLYQTGYMHNHCRMYTAMLACNIGEAHWLQPARWLYFHLLDADWASNSCSWQWVAGANSSKKYYANQENINKYTFTLQRGTYLDVSYEAIENLSPPGVLKETETLYLKTTLPEVAPLHINTRLDTCLYNIYNLDPLWHAQENLNRISLLEPSHFETYPVSEKTIDFVCKLGNNIPGLQIFIGEFNELASALGNGKLYFKEHPFNNHYTGIEEQRDWIAPEVSAYYPSFFAYWKQVEKYLMKHERG